MGGEKGKRQVGKTYGTGSPPRGRGKEQVTGQTAITAGITPAWAGKSRNLLSLRTGNKDHPRVGGEKTFSAPTENKRRGSPPRGRGKVIKHVHIVSLPGITPAWAGKRKFPGGWRFCL